MNWRYDPKTIQFRPKKETGIVVSARQGGIMVEDFDKNLQFLINYGTSRISHCFGCKPTDINRFNERDARIIADKVKRLGTGRGIDEIYFDKK